MHVPLQDLENVCLVWWWMWRRLFCCLWCDQAFGPFLSTINLTSWSSHFHSDNRFLVMFYDMKERGSRALVHHKTKRYCILAPNISNKIPHIFWNFPGHSKAQPTIFILRTICLRNKQLICMKWLEWLTQKSLRHWFKCNESPPSRISAVSETDVVRSFCSLRNTHLSFIFVI